MSIDKPQIAIDLPEEELRSLHEDEELFEDAELAGDSDDSTEEEEIPKRQRQMPDRYINEGWNLHAKKCALKMTPLDNNESLESSGEDDGLKTAEEGDDSTDEEQLPGSKARFSASQKSKENQAPQKATGQAKPPKFWVEIQPRKHGPSAKQA
ncbi:hypothetical protein P7C70_g7864, partial [Phenoliferia sp. Uapishka_3]